MRSYVLKNGVIYFSFSFNLKFNLKLLKPYYQMNLNLSENGSNKYYILFCDIFVSHDVEQLIYYLGYLFRCNFTNLW